MDWKKINWKNAGIGFVGGYILFTILPFIPQLNSGTINVINGSWKYSTIGFSIICAIIGAYSSYIKNSLMKIKKR